MGIQPDGTGTGLPQAVATLVVRDTTSVAGAATVALRQTGLTSTVTVRPISSATTRRADTGTSLPQAMVTSVRQGTGCQDGVDMVARTPSGLTSTVMARLTSSATTPMA